MTIGGNGNFNFVVPLQAHVHKKQKYGSKVKGEQKETEPIVIYVPPPGSNIEWHTVAGEFVGDTAVYDQETAEAGYKYILDSIHKFVCKSMYNNKLHLDRLFELNCLLTPVLVKVKEEHVDEY